MIDCFLASVLNFFYFHCVVPFWFGAKPVQSERPPEPWPSGVHPTGRSRKEGQARECGLWFVTYDRHVLDAGLDPVVAAAALAFGFVYIHPFADGNGRLHRWLIHHVSANAGFNPPALVFPISTAILRQLEKYLAVLQSYSGLLLNFIEWKPAAEGNVQVLNDTAVYYRYFDATAHVEFLYECVEQTVEHDLPDEVAHLQVYDRFSRAVQNIVDMPNQKIDLLWHFLRQVKGVLSKRARTNEFSALSEVEVQQVEKLYADSWEEGREV
jgi:hypothetical protein